MHSEARSGRQDCGYCGLEVAGLPAARRFSEVFCSEAHAEAFAAEVRQARVSAAAEVVSPAGAPAAGVWPRWKKLALCCGAPALLLIAIPLLLGGGGVLAAVGGSALSLAAVLACPLAMYFMVRAMRGHGKREDGEGIAPTPASGDEPERRAGARGEHDTR